MDLHLTIKSKSPNASVHLTRLPPLHTSPSRKSLYSPISTSSSTNPSSVFILTVSGTVTFAIQPAPGSTLLNSIELQGSPDKSHDNAEDGLILEESAETQSPSVSRRRSFTNVSVMAAKMKSVSRVLHSSLVTPPQTPEKKSSRASLLEGCPSKKKSISDHHTSSLEIASRAASPQRPSINIVPSSPNADSALRNTSAPVPRTQDPSHLQIPRSRFHPRGPKRLPQHPEWKDGDEQEGALGNPIDITTGPPPGLRPRTRLMSGPTPVHREPRSESDAKLVKYLTEQRLGRHNQVASMASPSGNLLQGRAKRNKLGESLFKYDEFGVGFKSGKATAEVEEKRLEAVAQFILKPSSKQLGTDLGSPPLEYRERGEPRTSHPTTTSSPLRYATHISRADASNKENVLFPSQAYASATLLETAGQGQYALYANYLSNVRDQRPPTPIVGNFPGSTANRASFSSPPKVWRPGNGGSAYTGTTLAVRNPQGATDIVTQGQVGEKSTSSTGVVVGAVPESRKRRFQS